MLLSTQIVYQTKSSNSQNWGNVPPVHIMMTLNQLVSQLHATFTVAAHIHKHDFYLFF